MGVLEIPILCVVPCIMVAHPEARKTRAIPARVERLIFGSTVFFHNVMSVSFLELRLYKGWNPSVSTHRQMTKKLKRRFPHPSIFCAVSTGPPRALPQTYSLLPPRTKNPVFLRLALSRSPCYLYQAERLLDMFSPGKTPWQRSACSVLWQGVITNRRLRGVQEALACGYDGERLRQFRTALGMTQEQLEATSGVSQGSMFIV